MALLPRSSPVDGSCGLSLGDTQGCTARGLPAWRRGPELAQAGRGWPPGATDQHVSLGQQGGLSPAGGALRSGVACSGRGLHAPAGVVVLESLLRRKGDENSPRDRVWQPSPPWRAEGCWGTEWGPRVALQAGGRQSADLCRPRAPSRAGTCGFTECKPGRRLISTTHPWTRRTLTFLVWSSSLCL